MLRAAKPELSTRGVCRGKSNRSGARPAPVAVGDRPYARAAALHGAAPADPAAR